MYGTRNDLSKATRVIWGLMDIQLPGADGYEATRRITANPVLRGIPVIVVTSCALRGDKVKALAAGANGYVSKPSGLLAGGAEVACSPPVSLAHRPSSSSR